MTADLRQISTLTKEGKWLIAALAKITTESQTDKTPDEVLGQIIELADKIYPPESNHEGVTAKDEEIARLKDWLDAAREDEAIWFAEWVRTRAVTGNDGTWHIKAGEQFNRSLLTKELYQLYLQYKKQNP